MQFRHSRRWPGVEPRFFARHLARNLLPTPSCPAPLAAVDSPVLTALPAWVAHLCAPATGPATHTAAACESPVRRPIAANCKPSSDPQLVACLPNSNADTSSLASFAAPWGVFRCLILGGHSSAGNILGISPLRGRIPLSRDSSPTVEMTLLGERRKADQFAEDEPKFSFFTKFAWAT